MNLTEYALNNRALVKFFIAVLVIGGVFAFISMSKLEDPEIKVKQAMILTVYPGASAHQVELEVTDVLEKSIRSMGAISTIESKSVADMSLITVELESTVSGGELEQKWDILRRKVINAQASLPSGTRPSVVMDDFGDVYGMFYAITTDGVSDEELMDYAQLVKRELQDIAGVRRVELYGDRKPCINIEILQDQMVNLGVHPMEVLATLNNQNKTVYPGYFNSGDQRIRVAVNDSYHSIEDIQDLIIQGHEGDQLRLRDIATVTKGYEEPSRNEMRYDGKRAFGLAVSMEKGGNIVSLGRIVDKKLTDLKTSRIPVGIDFHKVFFQPERVSEAIGVFMVNLVESVVIVILILMLTMGFRSGVIIGTGLVIIVLGSFVVLYLFDGTLQRVSLGSLIVAMGMLVDNAIVIVDGILVDLERGIKRPAALTNITKKTAMPLLGATLIAILAFFPIFISPDTTGEYVRDLFIVLAVSLLLSWILALTQIPIHADRSLKIQPKEGGEKLFDSKIYRLFRTFLTYILWHKKLAVAVVAVLLAITAYCYRYIPQGFFPDLSYSQLYVEFKMPEGTRIERVKSDLAEIERYLLNRPDITHVTTSLGGTPARYNLVRSIAEPSMSYGELIVDYTSPDALKSSLSEIQDYLEARYPDAYVRMKRYNLMYKKFPIELMFSGPDPAVLKELTAKAERIMRDEPAVMLVTRDWDPMVPVLMVNYYQPIARSAGLSRSDVGLSMLSATDGLPVGAYYEGTRSLPLYMKSRNSRGEKVEALDNIPVWSVMPSALNEESLKGLLMGTTSGEELLARTIGSTPLNQVTRGVSMKWEDPVVRRYNGQRAMRAQCNNALGYTAESARGLLAERIDTIALPEGYTMQWLGEHKASGESMKYLFANIPLAIILMIAILIMLFKDFRKPIIIFLCLPLATIGIVAGMLLSGKEFGFVAIVGALGLIGMMIKNGVVLLDEIGLQIASGKSQLQALLDSSSSRFRPVMMASLTTILGMIPLLGDDMFGSMAVTIMGGLLVGTVITLVFIPVLYAIFFEDKKEE
ncbi:efflux RND transporter permease subunit [Gabonibacter chumensis]|uniref:efflux RND transporter permease subunit n=1 Tax=Gabonibacter chumensis TaxID=2972474 RepID=UPI00257477A1|nr:efflux RND transporter permease subunit [Gabonibacter chumensis]MCR9011063.1 efflux RND transporter permease subunit [Gabonibacter chumensis]